MDEGQAEELLLTGTRSQSGHFRATLCKLNLCGVSVNASQAFGIFMVSVACGPDPAFEKYHDRAPLVLERDDYAAWLDSPESATALFTAPKKLSLQVELATV